MSSIQSRTVRVVAAVLSVVVGLLLLPLAPTVVLAEEGQVALEAQADDIASGEGWRLTSDGRLVIDGVVPAWDNAPSWYPYRERIRSAVALEGASVPSCRYMLNGCSSLMSADLSLLDVSLVTDMYSMFSGCSALTSLDLSGWDTSKVTHMGYMFSYCPSLASLDLSGWDTSSVTAMNVMFSGCSALTSLDLSAWDTSSLHYMGSMFQNCSSLSSLDLSGFDTSSVTDMSSMFAGCSSLASLDLSSWDTSSVENMYGMFSRCSSLASLDLSGWDTSRVTGMDLMFDGCSALTALDVSGFDTSSVEYMDYMFRDCSSLSALDVSGFNTSSVVDMRSMFENCSSLSALDVSGFNTSSVGEGYSMYSFDSMFSGCSALTFLDLTDWDTSSVTNMYGMFSGCSSLSSLDLSGWDTSSVEVCTSWGMNTIRPMYEGCSALSVWSIGSKYDTSKDGAVPPATSARGKWWSQKDQAWFACEEIAANRSGIADTYTYAKNSRPHSVPDFTSGDITLSIGSAIALGASNDNPAKIDIGVKWDDAWFFADSSKYNHDLGIASSVLASAVYHDDVYSHGTYAMDDLEKLGFDMMTCECYYPHTRDDYDGRIDQVGYCFAVKWINGGTTPLVAILVRGTTQNVEWVSNFNIAEHTFPSPEHEGFSRASESLITALRAYLTKGRGKEVDLGKAVYLVTGHSRGAGVANLVAHSLDEGAVSGPSGSSEKARVYAYTFASPNVSADLDAITGDWGNIFNIVNPDDLVPKMPLAKWEYGRYGITMVLPSKSNMSPKRWNTYYHHLLQPEFSALTKNKTLERYPSGAQASDEFADSMYSIAPSVEAYYRGDDVVTRLVHPSYLMEGVGYLLGDGSMDENIVAVGRFAYFPEFAGMLSRTVFKEFPEPNDVVTPYVETKGAFTDAHTSETYIASMKALDYQGFDFVESYRGFKAACPVDVRVYDDEGTLVCSIVDNVVDSTVMENGLAASVVGEVKCVDIPCDGQFRVEIDATDVGTMDITYQEMTAEGKAVDQVTFADMTLSDGGSYVAVLSQDDGLNGIQDDIAVTADDGTEVPPTRVSSDGDVSTIQILALVGEGEGSVMGGTLATWGDPVVLVATPAEGSAFCGWYEDGALISDKETYQFRAERNRTLEARFAEAPGPFFLDADPADNANHGAEVDWMGKSGISEGWGVEGGRVYNGLWNVKRCDFAAFLYRMADLTDDGERNDSCAPTDEEVAATLAGVSDCDATTAHSMEVAWLIGTGISRGWGNGDGTVSFRPTSDIKRQDMAAFLHRFADLADDGEMNGSPQMGPQQLRFSDVAHGDEANHASDVEWLASVGVTRGWDNHDGTYSFGGLRDIVRQDMAAFMKRLYDHMAA